MASNMAQGTTSQWHTQEASTQPQDNLKCPPAPSKDPSPRSQQHGFIIVLRSLLCRFRLPFFVFKPHDSSQTAQESPQDSPKSN